MEDKGCQESVLVIRVSVIWYCFEISASIFEFSSGEQEAIVHWPLLGAFLIPPVLLVVGDSTSQMAALTGTGFSIFARSAGDISASNPFFPALI